MIGSAFAHFHLNSFSRMTVRLAMQVFGKRAQEVLQMYGSGNDVAQLDLMRCVDEFVDAANGDLGNIGGPGGGDHHCFRSKLLADSLLSIDP